jgi:hypothetical protein
MSDTPSVRRRGRYDATVQLPESRAARRRIGLKLALTGVVAFAFSLGLGAVLLEASLSDDGIAPLVTPSPRSVARLAPRALDVDELSAFVRLVAMDRAQARRAAVGARRR